MGEMHVEIEIESDTFGIDNWTSGGATVNGRQYGFEVKHYEEPSQFGIDGGRISKLFLRETGTGNIVQYERGWPMLDDDGTIDRRFTPEGRDADTMAVYERLLELYN